MRRLLLVVIAAAVFAVGLGWLVVVAVPRWFTAGSEPSAPPVVDARQDPVRKINASLFYVSEDGTQLVAVRREVAFAETPTEQAMRLLEEQFKPAPAPYAQVIPAGTTVRSVFLTGRGEAYVDLSPEVTSAHTGGSLDELFSVYVVVNTLTVNLPLVKRVQILVDGKEVDSLAGHVDLRRPLPRNLTWVARPAQATPEGTGVIPDMSSPSDDPAPPPAPPGRDVGSPAAPSSS